MRRRRKQRREQKMGKKLIVRHDFYVQSIAENLGIEMFTSAYIQKMSVCYSEGQAEETRDRYRDGLTEESRHRADRAEKTKDR